MKTFVETDEETKRKLEDERLRKAKLQHELEIVQLRLNEDEYAQ